MNESFVHYVWQFQYFQKNQLITSTGDLVIVFDPGLRNSNAGPDFLNARIKIGEIQWIGNVEIHIKASNWIDHAHEYDAGYDNVILHVVWQNDVPVHRHDGSVLPAIEIADRVDSHLLNRYKQLVHSMDMIPCAASIP